MQQQFRTRRVGSTPPLHTAKASARPGGGRWALRARRKRMCPRGIPPSTSGDIKRSPLDLRRAGPLLQQRQPQKEVHRAPRYRCAGASRASSRHAQEIAAGPCARHPGHMFSCRADIAHGTFRSYVENPLRWVIYLSRETARCSCSERYMGQGTPP